MSTPRAGTRAEGDQYGRKVLLQAAIVIFLAGSALCGLSQSMNELIAFSALQGIGGGGLLVVTIAAVSDIIAPRDRGRYQGYFGAVFGVATVLGPLLGGFFVDTLSWRWIFYVNLPIGLIALAEIERALSLLASREHRWELYQRLAARAGLDLSPPQLWLLARLGERSPTSQPQLLQQLSVDPGRIAATLEQLQEQSLVRYQDGLVTLTASGRDDYERLVAARCAGLREHLNGWDPDQHPELRQLIDSLGRDLVSQLPTPTPVAA